MRIFILFQFFKQLTTFVFLLLEAISKQTNKKRY